MFLRTLNSRGFCALQSFSRHLLNYFCGKIEPRTIIWREMLDSATSNFTTSARKKNYSVLNRIKNQKAKVSSTHSTRCLICRASGLPSPLLAALHRLPDLMPCCFRFCGICRLFRRRCCRGKHWKQCKLLLWRWFNSSIRHALRHVCRRLPPLVR